MEQISDKVLHQRLRNRVIEILDLCSSLPDVARIGAFSVINWAYDFLPADFHTIPALYSRAEQDALTAFSEALELTCDATKVDIHSLDKLESITPWQNLSECALDAMQVLLVRARFSEVVEEKNFNKASGEG